MRIRRRKGALRRKRAPLNEMVLRRLQEQRARRSARNWRITKLVIIASQLAMVGYFQWSLHYRPLAPKVNVSASTPQSFNLALNEDGVPMLLNINGEMWGVVRAKSFEDSELAGVAFCQAKAIAYLPSDAMSVVRETLVHEVFHAGACTHGGDTWWNSENPNSIHHEGVYRLGSFWTGFARANPEFMEWLIR